ncbi:uncharacterized protein LOC131237121 isoform X2 [Magnolia sinica]|uniref:uncharacterized protein LOC131237121 isoform X2 n=1 Tax=Magnolia sinica TaxID=86752 RepID=UPI0026582E9E|nr:uncharacterized protein LOC131237121 isoform X2 [Magnolia sinica]
MAYIPPHKRHSKDTEKPTPTPSLLIPKFQKKLNIGPKSNLQRRKDQDALQDVNNIAQSFEKSPCVYITEKIQLDLHNSFQNVRNEMEFEKSEEVKPSFVARFGKIFFHGSPSISLDTILKSSAAETTSRNQVKKSFYTNVPSAYMEAVQCLVVPKIGVDFESEKEHYHVKVYDKSLPDATISCKCSIGKHGKLECHKAELNQVRHLVADISCLDKDLDLRLMLSTKRILTALTDEDEESIRELIKSAIVDPDVKGGLRWPLGKESFGDRFCVVGVWHTKYKAFRSPMLRLKLRDADRFDFRTSAGEVGKEVTLKMTGIVKQLMDGMVETGFLNESLHETLKMIWDNFLDCDYSVA